MSQPLNTANENASDYSYNVRPLFAGCGSTISEQFQRVIAVELVHNSLDDLILSY